MSLLPGLDFSSALPLITLFFGDGSPLGKWFSLAESAH
jgi:hypothetical protein